MSDCMKEVNDAVIMAYRVIFWLSAEFFVICLLVGYMLFG